MLLSQRRGEIFMVMKGKVFYSTYSSNSSRCSMGIVSSNTLMKKEGIVTVHRSMNDKQKANTVQTRRPSRISLSRNNSRRCRARLNRNITFVYTQNWMSSQTHSLSMEKQVTGPSAAQVAVLKTSLQEEKHCTWQPGKAVCHYCTYALVNNSVWKKGKFSCQKVEKTLHQHLKSTTFYMFCVVATGLSPSEWMNYSRSWHLQHINICKKKRKLFAKEVRKCCIFINSLISMLHKSASEKPPNKTAKLLQRTLTGWYLIFNEKPPLHNQYVCQLQVCCHIF